MKSRKWLTHCTYYINIRRIRFNAISRRSDGLSPSMWITYRERRKQTLRMKNPPWKTMREKINNNKQTNNLKNMAICI